MVWSWVAIGLQFLAAIPPDASGGDARTGPALATLVELVPSPRRGLPDKGFSDVDVDVRGSVAGDIPIRAAERIRPFQVE